MKTRTDKFRFKPHNGESCTNQYGLVRGMQLTTKKAKENKPRFEDGAVTTLNYTTVLKQY